MVKAFRGQRKCQFTEEQKEGSFGYSPKCGMSRDEHSSGPPGAVVATVPHSFTQKALRCESCGDDINVGDPYKWVKPRAHRATSGRKRNRHQACPGWKASELTSSEVLGIIYGAQEGAESDLAATEVPTDADDADSYTEALSEALSTFASEIEGAVEVRREAGQAIEEGFGHATEQSQQLEDDADSLDSWVQEINGVYFDSYSGENIEEDLETWADEQREKAEEMIQENPI